MEKNDKNQDGKVLEKLRKLMLHVETAVLSKFKESFPGQAKTMEEAFNEYVEVSNKLLAELGDEFSTRYVEQKIPNNKFLILMNGIMKVAARQVDQLADHFKSSIKRTSTN